MRILPILFCLSFLLPAQQPKPTPALKQADFERYLKELSNWGRWGKDDQLGAINLITPAKRRAAANLVREGFTVSLSHQAEKEKTADNPRPFLHQMLSDGKTPNAQAHSDSFTVAHHGLAHTHLDSLCHFFWNNQMYNGITRDVVTAKGAEKLSVYNYRDGLFTRAVLMDIPKLRGVPYLEPGAAIFPEDLDAWAKQAGFKVEPGDIVLVRTGRWVRRKEKGPWSGSLAGLHMSSAAWLKKHDVAVLGGDSAQDVMPSGVEGVGQPVHLLVLVAMGMPILDNVDLERLAEECAKRKRWDFLLTTAPLAVEGATGSALNPIAVF
ncbi:MAG: cyclase family protein [Bryobacterales bacterium]|nr:cyclase family protein [Bryobacterales bacterium]